MQAVKFEELVENIGISIQKARKLIEEQSVELYFREYENKVSSEEIYTPKTKCIGIPVNTSANAGHKIIEVPVTALHNHSTMALDSVDIKLKFTPCIENDELYLSLKPCQESEEVQDEYSELSLHFKNGEVSEGMSRMTEKSVKLL